MVDGPWPILWPEDRDVIRSPEWRPTREAFARYAAREVELARRNIRIAQKRGGKTLHSHRTVMLAAEVRTS